ncbi:uncharacterized protein LOC136081386 [Hydra vulgaris]|uniref:Uncharacterized protein LOC136081386 n=1 Tax=Hydra vulgaris TaxID=6087 RepID=A0ABM4BZY9_HYDVU
MVSVVTNCKSSRKIKTVLKAPLLPERITELNCIYLNATSLENKLDELKVVTSLYCPKIVGVSETWFKNNSIVNIPGYNIYRYDRTGDRRGGGVCLYIKNSIDSYELVDTDFSISKIEQVWAVVYFGQDKYLVGFLYRPNYFVDMVDFDNIFKIARRYVDVNAFKDVLIMGDFNFAAIKWSNGSIASISNDSGIEHKFYKTLSDTFLYQQINIPTFQLANGSTSNVLDLIFTTESGSVYAVDPSFVLGDINKGHQIIYFKLVLKNNFSRLACSNFKFLYSKAKFDNISDFMSNIDWVKLYENKTVQDMYNELIYYTTEACNLFVPTIDISRIKSLATPWINNEIKQLIRRKRNLRYINCAHRWNDVNLTKEYKQLFKLVKTEIYNARLLFEKNLVLTSKLNPKLLYKYLNSTNSIKDSIKAMRMPDGNLSREPNKIVNCLNKHFQDVFTIEEKGDLPPFYLELNNVIKFKDIEPDDISFDLVLSKLKSLKDNKSPGADKLCSIVLKNCATSFTLPLTLIFRESLKTSQLPIQFKSANVTPIYKKGDKTVASNYRPISLTSIPCKILESIIRERIE